MLQIPINKAIFYFLLGGKFVVEAKVEVARPEFEDMVEAELEAQA